MEHEAKLGENAALIQDIERASLWAWPPERTAGVGGWLLRQGATATRRQSSVQALAFSGEVPLERAVAEVEAWYGRHGKPACFQLNQASQPPGLDALLGQRGYRLAAPSEVWVRSLASVPPEPAGVELEGRPTALVMQAVADPRAGPTERAALAGLFGRIRRPHSFAVRVLGGAPVAGGLVVVDGPLAGILAMRAAPGSRRQGHGRAVLERLLGWARAMGARTAYLQVELANEPALGLYGQAGFERLYGYHYRTAPLDEVKD